MWKLLKSSADPRQELSFLVKIMSPGNGAHRCPWSDNFSPNVWRGSSLWYITPCRLAFHDIPESGKIWGVYMEPRPHSVLQNPNFLDWRSWSSLVSMKPDETRKSIDILHFLEYGYHTWVYTVCHLVREVRHALHTYFGGDYVLQIFPAHSNPTGEEVGRAETRKIIFIWIVSSRNYRSWYYARDHETHQATSMVPYRQCWKIRVGRHTFCISVARCWITLK